MRSLIVLLALACSTAAWADPVTLPDTPAGRFVATFLKAYNSADPEELKRYNALYNRSTPPEDWIAMHDETGDLTPVRIDSASENAIDMLLAAAKGDDFWRENITMDPADPMKLAGGGLSMAERPPEYAIPRVSQAELAKLVDAKAAADVAADKFSGVVLVERHGRVVYSGAWGLADREAGIPVTPDTKFRMGSANKMFTAASVLQLVEAGKISLDGTVGQYLPDYPNADFAKTVTVRQLLSHTGGAGDIFTPDYMAKRLEVKTHADYVALFGERPQGTGKDGQNQYANYGFVLLGRIVEIVSGQDYYTYVHKHLFNPAGMKDTASLPEDVAVPKRSKGYTKGAEGKLASNVDTLPYRGTAAGGGYTTAPDMLRFFKALRDGKLLSKALLDQATTAQRPDNWYGFGMFLAGSGETRNWGHGGGAPGMNTNFRVYPESDTVIAVLSNLDPMGADQLATFYANRMPLKN